MNLKSDWLGKNLGTMKTLSYKRNLIFALFFLVPTTGFLYFAYKYDILSDMAVPYFFILLLVALLFGFSLLRRTFDQLSDLSREIQERLPSHVEQAAGRGGDELETIADSFAVMENRIDSLSNLLERKMFEVSVLKELSDLCYVTLDPEELLHVTLDRALKVADADMGSVMILDDSSRDHFVVKTTIGLGDHVSTGDRVDFATSVAKYAIINKSPLVIENIETDSRFGRLNRPHYGTKSFICMPIKTSRDIIGVLTVSRRHESPPFTMEQADAIAPLLSNAAFTFENLRFAKERESQIRLARSWERICGMLGASFGERERVRSILGELRNETGFRRGFILLRDEVRRNVLRLYEYDESGSDREGSAIRRNNGYSATHPLFEQVLRRGDSIIVNDSSRYSLSPEQGLMETGNGDSLFVVPMKNDGVVIGILLLAGLGLDALKNSRRLVEQAAAVLALAFVKSGLSLAVERRAGELASLKQIGGALASSTFDMKQVLSYTMDMLKSTMQVGAGSLLLAKDGELEYSDAFGMNLDDLRRRNLKLGQGIAGYAAARGESVMVNDVASSVLFHADLYETADFVTKSVLAVPLVSQGRVIGVLEVLNKVTGDFVDDDLQLLQSIASSVSIALENARLYGETLSMAEQEREVRRIFQKFVPKEIVDKIIHGTKSEVKLQDEFRTLTLLNIDIRDFSSMAKRVGPQKTVSLLNYFFSVMGEIVFKHEGIVDKYLGDGFLALFGAPFSTGFDADNAVRAALEMREALLTLNERFVEEAGRAISVGISIHTGEVVVGNIGFEKKMDYTVIGDSVNAVFRIQNLTRRYANGILVSEMTRRALRCRFVMREVGKSDIDVAPGETSIYEVLTLEDGQEIGEIMGTEIGVGEAVR